MSRIDRVLAGTGVALGLAGMAVDHLLGDDPGLEDPPAFLISAAVILVITALLFGRVVRRSRNPGRAGFIVAVLAVASLPLIWLGVPFAVARTGGNRTRKERRRTARDCGGRDRQCGPLARHGRVQL
jgi:hypothetical protein